MDLLIIQFSPSSCHFSLFGPNILLSTLFSNILSQELLGFWTLSIIRYARNWETQCCIGETGKSLAMWLCEHRNNLKQGLLEESALAHRVSRGEVESNSRYRKFKKSTHMTCLSNLMSQHSLDISLIQIPLVSNEVTNSKKSV
jgi:hypothetical protein